MTTTNYTNTFIEIADDCPVDHAEVPPVKTDLKSVAAMQYEMIKANPYKYTSDDVIFSIYADRSGIIKSELTKEKENFFSKGQPCFRSSPLAKRYGWGIHSDPAGKIAIYAVESDDYKKLKKDKKLVHLKAMRSKREGK